LITAIIVPIGKHILSLGFIIIALGDFNFFAIKYGRTKSAINLYCQSWDNSQFEHFHLSSISSEIFGFMADLLDDKNDIKLLSEMLFTGDDLTIQQNSIRLLYLINNISSQKVLFRALSNHSSPDIRIIAIELINTLQSDDSFNSLSNCLKKDRNPSVRKNAALAISDYKEKAIPQLLLALERDSNYEVRLNCAIGLSSIADPVCLLPLHNALSIETNQEVRIELLNAIANNKNFDNVKLLIEHSVINSNRIEKNTIKKCIMKPNFDISLNVV